MVDFHAYATILLIRRQPHRVSAYNAQMLPFFIEASEVVCKNTLVARLPYGETLSTWPDSRGRT